MQKISSLIINKIERKSETQIEITCLFDGLERKFEVVFAKIGVHFEKDLEFLLRANDILFSKQILQILQDYKNDHEIDFPIMISIDSPRLQTV